MFDKFEEAFITKAIDPMARDNEINRLKTYRGLNFVTFLIIAVAVVLELFRGNSLNIVLTFLFIVTMFSGSTLNSEIRLLKILKRLNISVK